MPLDASQTPANLQNGERHVFKPAPPAAGGCWFAVAAVVVLLAGVGAPALLLHAAWAFGTLNCRVDDQGVKVHHGLRRIVIPHEAIPDVTVHETAPRMGRIAGTSLGGYR